MAVHAEPCAFVIVQDRDTLRILSERAKAALRRRGAAGHLDRGGHTLDVFTSPGFNIFYDVL